MDNRHLVNGHGEQPSDLATTTGCLSEADLADYVGGLLSGAAYESAARHLATCDACREKAVACWRVASAVPHEEDLAAYAATPEDVNRYLDIIGLPAPAPRRSRTTLAKAVQILFPPVIPRWAYGLALALVLAGASVLAWWRPAPKSYERLYAQGLSSLQSTPSWGHTPSELYLVAGSPTREIRQSGGEPPDWALDSALVHFSQAVGTNPRYVRAHVGLGQVYLLKRQPAEAQKHFEAALRLDANDAEAVNGLGIAWFEQAMAAEDPSLKDQQLRAAAEQFAKNLKAGRAPLETLYNQAKTYYELGDKVQALDLIERYLAQDAQSLWAERLSAIRDKLRLISYREFEKEVDAACRPPHRQRLAQIVATSPHAPWLIKRSLLASIGKEVDGDPAGARQLFERAAALDDAYREYTGDAGYLPLFEYYGRLSAAEKRRTAEAYRLTMAAGDCFTTGDVAESLRLAEQGLSVFKQLGNGWAEASISHIQANAYFYQRFAYSQASIFYEASLKAAASIHDRDAMIRALSGLGVAAQAQGRHDEARAYLDQVLGLAEGLRDTFHQAFAFNAFGILYRGLGYWDEAARYHGRALALNRRFGNAMGQLETLQHLGWLYQQTNAYHQSLRCL